MSLRLPDCTDSEKIVQKAIRVSSKLGFTDEVSSQILIRELLPYPFLEDLIALIEKDFRDRGGHCSGVGFIFLPLPKHVWITNLHAGSWKQTPSNDVGVNTLDQAL